MPQTERLEVLCLVFSPFTGVHSSNLEVMQASRDDSTEESTDLVLLRRSEERNAMWRDGMLSRHLSGSCFKKYNLDRSLSGLDSGSCTNLKP